MSKRPRDETDAGAAPHLSPEELAQLLATGAEIPSLDGNGVKRLLLALERAISANRAARAKHAAEPLRYLESEVALHGALQALQALAAAPEHYGALLSSGSLPSLLDLLTHENSDVAAGVVALLGELLGNEEAGEDAEGVEGAARRALLGALAGAGALELLGHTAARFHGGCCASAAAAAPSASAVEADNAARDAEALVATLELLQAMVALQPGLALALCTAQPPVLLATLLARVAQGAELDECKGAAAELLAVLATPSGGGGSGASSSGGNLACARAIGATPVAAASAAAPPGASRSRGAATGMEALLEALAAFRKRGPRGADEEELVGNLFDTLCTCLLVPENRAFFLAAEGCELMLVLIREAGYARHGALRVLSYACIAGESGEEEGSSSSSSSSRSALRTSIACAIIHGGALKHLFPAFMGLGVGHTRREHGAAEAEREEEYCLGIVEALLAALPREAPGGGGGAAMERLRLVAKFSEEQGAKAQRLVELRRKYAGLVQGSEEKLEAAAAAAEDDDAEEEAAAAAELAEAEAAEALSRALAMLQRIDLTIARLLMEGHGGSGGGGGGGGSGAAGGASSAAPAPAAARVRAEAAFCLRAKLHEQGCSLVDTLECLSGYAEGLVGGSSSSERERVEVQGMVETLARAWGLEGGSGDAGEGQPS